MSASKTKEIPEHDSALRYGELVDEVRAYRSAMAALRRDVLRDSLDGYPAPSGDKDY